MTVRLFAARAVIAAPDRFLEGGGLVVEGSSVREVLASPAAVRRAERRLDVRALDLGELVLTPGLVNAHAHLELTELAGELPAARGPVAFGAWIAAILDARAKRRAHDFDRGHLEGAARCLATGTTTVGDIDSTGAGERIGARSGLRLRLYRELLDAHDPERTGPALARARRRLPARSRRLEGLSPHAPYTVSEGLLRGVAREARRRSLALTIHWAETEAETAWMRTGTGPLAARLGVSPRRDGLSVLLDAGVVGRRTSLVHGNHPERGDPARIARAGAALVHCPGTHRFFGRDPFPWKRYRRAGVRLALGTDSLASNEDLDLGREMALARAGAPWLSPAEVWEMATLGGARAVGLEGRVGVLRRGALADWAAHRLTPGSELEELTSEPARPVAVWVGGRRAFAQPGFRPKRGRRWV